MSDLTLLTSWKHLLRKRHDTSLLRVEGVSQALPAAQRLRTALAAIPKVRVLDRGRELCAIVSVSIEGRDPRQIVGALRARRINTNAQVRVYAVMDFDEKGVAASLRLSPHYYNTEEEIDEAADAIRELLQTSG